MRKIKKGSTDRSAIIRIIDSTDGTPETGVAYNTSGIDLWYRREGATVTSITEATLSALTDAHTDGGILHIGNGYYRLDLPDAAWATGADHVMIGGTVTGMIVIGQEIQLVNYDVDDLESRLTAARAGYLDNLSGGAVALASGVTVTTNNDKTGFSLSSAGVTAIVTAIWAGVIEGTTTFAQWARAILSGLFGKTSGAATGTLVFRDKADSKNRYTVVCDEDGNRTTSTAGDLD